MIKVLENIGLESTYCNIIVSMYEKPIAKFTLTEAKLEAATLKPEMGQDVHYPHSFSTLYLKYQLEQPDKRRKLKVINREIKSQAISIYK